MNINKAIEILELNILMAGPKMPPDTLKAVMLSTEALKAWRDHREVMGFPSLWTLPGEDPE